jgi:PhnB protein
VQLIMAVKHIPDGYHSVTPYLIVNAGQRALDYYKQAFGASELFRMDAPGGKIGHAEIQIGDSRLMLSDENPAWGAKAPTSGVSPPVQLMIYVDDVDTMFKRALAAGAKEIQPIKDQFYGDRSGTLTDPFGHVWTIATHVEDVSADEMQRRAAEYMKQQPQSV